MDLNVQAKIKEYRARAKQAGLQFGVDPACEVANAGMNSSGMVRITVPHPLPTWDKARWIQWDYECEHEIGHLMPKVIDHYDVLKEKQIKRGSFMGSMLNVASDHIQEYRDYGVFKGRAERLNAGRRVFLDSQDATMLGKRNDDHMLAFESFYVWDTLIRESWMPSLVGKGEELLQYMTEQQLDWIDKLQAGDYEVTLKSNIDGWGMYDLVKRVISEVYEFDAEQEEQDAQQDQEEQEGGKGDEGTDKEDAEGGSESDGAGDEGDEDGTAKGGTVKYSDLLAHIHEDDGKLDNKGAYPINIEYDANTCEFTPRDEDTFITLDYTNNSIALDTDGGYARDLLSGVEKHMCGTGLAKHVRRLLQARSAAKYQHGLKRGKVSGRSVHRVATGSDKIFRKKQEVNVLNTAVTVLCDMSGSMSWGKSQHAAISMMLLNEAISKINIPLELLGFDDYTSPRHAIWKQFNKRVSNDTLKSRIADATERMYSNNSDGESILWAYRRLVQRKEVRKILIVLSDGQPATSYGDADWFTKEVNKQIEKEHKVELYGIGILDDSVERLYTDRQVINHASELEGALLNVIERKILS